MNSIQEKILELLYNFGFLDLKYREIARKIGEIYPEKIKYHLKKLVDNGLILIDEKNKKIKRITQADALSNIYSLPIYGSANCGEAVSFAQDQIEGYLKISKKILPNFSKDLYVLKASGNSMNQAKVGSNRKTIEDGDFVIIDSKYRNPKPGDYIVSVIDGCANIKEFRYDQNSGQVLLTSKSSGEYFPIVLDESDNFHVMGKVINVIKNF